MLHVEYLNKTVVTIPTLWLAWDTRHVSTMPYQDGVGGSQCSQQSGRA
jgi:hypothetical protein